jgi:hypothetical protein
MPQFVIAGLDPAIHSVEITVRLAGVAMPWRSPSATTWPDSHGISIRPPRSRSSSIEALIFAGTSAMNDSVRSAWSAGRSTPSARPTAAHSSTRRTRNAPLVSASARIGPMGARNSPVAPLRPTMSTNFAHRST